MKPRLIILSIAMLAGVACAQGDDHNQSVLDNNGRQPKLGILGGGAATLSRLAQDLFSRSSASSQVLSLNITNLVILLVIKALIFGAGSLGFGGGDHIGRSIDDQQIGNSITDNKFMSEPELLLILSYLNGDMNQKYDCLHYAACNSPAKAKEYILAGKLLAKGISMMNVSKDVNRYEKLLSEVQEAVNYGQKGYDCSIRYSCNA